MAGIKVFKFFTQANMLYVIIFMVDYVVELFRITESGYYTTLLGMQIDMVMDKHGIETNFSLLWWSLLLYILFVISFTLIRMISSKHIDV